MSFWFRDFELDQERRQLRRSGLTRLQVEKGLR
jgi:hypothetical protein